MMHKYCVAHTDRLIESNVDIFLFETMVIKSLADHGKFEQLCGLTKHCFLCETDESSISKFIRQATVLDAKVIAGDGSYTDDEIAIYKGKP